MKISEMPIAMVEKEMVVKRLPGKYNELVQKVRELDKTSGLVVDCQTGKDAKNTYQFIKNYCERMGLGIDAKFNSTEKKVYIILKEKNRR